VIKVGLTGGIGSGKSTVAAMFVARGATLVDADAIARELTEPGEPALHALVEEFGPEIIAVDGTLRRAELARIAFSDPTATARLNAVMHPLIRAESQRRLEAAEGAEIVLYDMPLLVESKQDRIVDIVVVVDVPEEMQVDRAVNGRGLDEADVRRRMEVQATRAQRLSMAHYTIDNSGTLASTEHQVEQVWDSLVVGR
jgi:dephospho-CoA kinase